MTIIPNEKSMQLLLNLIQPSFKIKIIKLLILLHQKTIHKINLKKILQSNKEILIFLKDYKICNFFYLIFFAFYLLNKN